MRLMPRFPNPTAPAFKGGKVHKPPMKGLMPPRKKMMPSVRKGNVTIKGLGSI